MGTVFDEVGFKVFLDDLRYQQDRLCHQRLGLELAPREAFNRWIEDIYSLSHTQSKLDVPFPEAVVSPVASSANRHRNFADVVCPPFLNADVWKNREQHILDFHARILKREVSTSFFWELLDDVPSRLILPPVTCASARLLLTARKNDQNVSVVFKSAAAAAKSTTACNSENYVFFNPKRRKTVGMGLLKKNDELQNRSLPVDSQIQVTIDAFTSLLLSVAAELHQTLSVTDVKVNEDARQKSSLTSLLYGKSFSRRMQLIDDWVTLIVPQANESNFCCHSAVSLLVDAGLLKDEMANDKAQQPQTISFDLKSLTQAIKEMRRPLLTFVYGKSVVLVCCELERLWHVYNEKASHGIRLRDQYVADEASKEEIHSNTRIISSILQKGIEKNPNEEKNLCEVFEYFSFHLKITNLSIDDTIHFVLLLNDPCPPQMESSTALHYYLPPPYDFMCISIHARLMANLFVKYLDKTTETTTICAVDFNRFLNQVFRLIIRYNSLCGYGKNGGRGIQAAIPPQLWNCLHSSFEMGLECFASPFNAYSSNYFSIFPDVDAFFGSKGAFFDRHIKLLSGVHQLNPPFVEPVMSRMASKLLEWLKESETPPNVQKNEEEENQCSNSSSNSNSNSIYNNPGPLMFFVFVPDWDNGSYCASMDILLRQSTKYLIHALKLHALNHKYASYETCQHSINLYHTIFDIPHHMYMNSSTTTTTTLASDMSTPPPPPPSHLNEASISPILFSSISSSYLIILQNSLGKTKWPITKSFLSRLENAFQ